ncbi:MAG: cyclic pyranopterin monophosphate synthase [Leptospiraceae bacterium]|nr:MAG: cyclic pyranopterin monophosphate synthase [Leptospiraceae bacterium]
MLFITPHIYQDYPESKNTSFNSVYDSYGRTFQTIRLSLLPVCNFQCIYCKTEEENYKYKIQKPDYFIKLIYKIKKIINIKKIHLTGGEPTLYPYLEEIVKGLKSLNIPEVSITTNGTLLLKKLHTLKMAGIDSINLSLDAIDNSVLKKMGTKKQFEFYDKLINEILNLNISLKINTTILKGFNENQILPLLEYCGKRNIIIRYLEYMLMGVSETIHKERFFSMFDILNEIQKRYQIKELKREKHSTANYWLTDTNYKFGIIANHSKPFCMDCDRLRIDYNGNLYGCITQKKGIPMDFSDSENEIYDKLNIAIKNKQLIFKGSSNKMHYIGG